MTDEEFIAIALQLWQQNQGAEFTMERLVEATGISRATIYRRFGSREAILQRLATEQALDVQELLRPDIPTRIIQATRTILNRTGVSSATVELIAQEAGVGPATVYRHFGSKEGVIQAFVQASSPRTLLRYLTAERDSDLEADLVLLAHAMLEFVRNNPGIIRIIVFESQSGDAVFEQVRETQGRTVTMLAKYLADHMALGNLPAGDSFALALAFMGLLLGFAFIGPHSYNHPITDTEAAAKLATHLFLRGVTQPQLDKAETVA